MGLKAWNFQKQFFEIIVDQKSPLSGPSFWLGYEAQDSKGARGGHAHFLIFPTKMTQKIKIGKKYQISDFSSPIDR